MHFLRQIFCQVIGNRFNAMSVDKTQQTILLFLDDMRLERINHLCHMISTRLACPFK